MKKLTYFFSDDISLPKEKIILNLNNYPLKVNDFLLANSINLLVKGGEHITLIGSNGVGKTTLLKQILKELKNTLNIHVGYMPQNYDELLDYNTTPVQYLQMTLGYDKDMQSKIMTSLGALNFLETEMQQKVSDLSGGQKAKLFLLNLVLNKYDVLILDEPTRNLSPLSNPIIRKIIKEFHGTVISVSHDRKYIQDVSHRVYHLKNNGLFEVKVNEI